MTTRLAVLDPRNWRDIVRAYRYLVTAGWRIFVRRERVDEWPSVARPSTDGILAGAEAARIARAARWTNTAARYPVPWARCLQRSLALCLWLEQMGMAPALRFGVRKSSTGIDAHAWVEYKGQIVNDSEQVSDVFVTLENKESANR